MTKRQHQDIWEATARRAFASGARPVRPGLLSWDIATKCSDPVWIDYQGAEPRLTVGQEFRAGMSTRMAKLNASLRAKPPESSANMHLEMWVPCRKCEGCLKQRARHWRMRVEAELRNCPGRSWFGTLTASPYEHSQALYRARIRLARRSVVLETLTPADRFSEHVNELGQEITLWLKRVRKESGSVIRYCLVAEAHKSGLPHFHLVIHEMRGTVLHKTLKHQWRLGFSDFKLVAQGEEAGAARYVAKYLTKAATSRVRASAAYGSEQEPLALGHSGNVKKSDHPHKRESIVEEGLINERSICRGSYSRPETGESGQTVRPGEPSEPGQRLGTPSERQSSEEPFQTYRTAAHAIWKAHNPPAIAHDAVANHKGDK